MIKKGDTLIEVTIAIGIFSLIAITIAAVMSSGTSGSQTALETTLAREEIDAQAEALRFIHESYITSKDANQGNPYYKLWNAIKGRANSNSNSTEFNPSSCKALYDDNILNNQKAFILNTKQLNSGESALISYNRNIFEPTSTYPHTVYGGNRLDKAYGIYIVAVPDGGTNIVGQSNTGVTAFYDFYIRTCWYGLDAERPSNISTVIRLYDPPEAQATSPELGDNYIIIYRHGKEDGEWYNEKYKDKQLPSLPPQVYLKKGETFTLPNPGTRFKYWAYDAEGDYPVAICGDNRQCVTPSSDDNFKLNSTTSLYAQWDDDESYIITYDLNEGSFNNPLISESITCKPFEECDRAYRLIATTPTRPGYKFTGWRCTEGCQDSTKLYQPGEYFGTLPGSVTFTANWKDWYSIVYYDIDDRELCSTGSETDPGYYTINCNETLKNPGEGQKFYGWSPDDSTIYQEGDTINSSTTGDRTVRLKPYWRVNITFSSEGWTPSSSGTIESCYIFNYAKPTSGSYYSVKKGAKYGSYNIAPADGYVVSSGGKHIEVLDSGIINLQGYCYRAANESVSYTVGEKDTFELSAQMNTAGMRTHPGGYASISIGPITATINSNNITSKCQSSSGLSYSFTSGNVINLKIEKHSNDYSVTVNGNVLKSCTVDTNSDVQVKYAMVHYDHYCSELFNVQLTGINMQRYIKKY